MLRKIISMVFLLVFVCNVSDMYAVENVGIHGNIEAQRLPPTSLMVTQSAVVQRAIVEVKSKEAQVKERLNDKHLADIFDRVLAMLIQENLYEIMTVDMLVFFVKNLDLKREELKTKLIEFCLIIATVKGFDGVIKKLILADRTRVNNVKGSNGESLLHRSCFVGNVEMVRWLIVNGADLEARDNKENTPLMIACYEGYGEVVKELIKAGADFEVKNIYDATCIRKAIINEYFEIVEILIKAGADIEVLKDSDTIYLWKTFIKKQHYLLGDMLEIFAKVGEFDQQSILLLKTLYIEENYIPEVYIQLSSNPASLLNVRGLECSGINSVYGFDFGVFLNNDANYEGHTETDTIIDYTNLPWWWYSAEEVTKKARYVPKNNPNYLLIHAIKTKQHVDFIRRLLIFEKADPNAVDDEGKSALDYAILLQNAKVVEILLSAGAKGTDSRFKPANENWFKKNPEVVRVLMNLLKKNYHAVYLNDEDLTDVLIEFIDVDKTDKSEAEILNKILILKKQIKLVTGLDVPMLEIVKNLPVKRRQDVLLWLEILEKIHTIQEKSISWGKRFFGISSTISAEKILLAILPHLMLSDKQQSKWSILNSALTQIGLKLNFHDMFQLFCKCELIGVDLETQKKMETAA